MSVKLEDIIPQRSEFKLNMTGKTYYLRPFTIADELWLQNKFGSRLQEILEECKMLEICQIAFHLMDDESKQEFVERDVKIINDETGQSFTEKRGGYTVLFCMVSGHKEKKDILMALLQSIGLSKPIVDKLIAEEDAKKKENQPTGQ